MLAAMDYSFGLLCLISIAKFTNRIKFFKVNAPYSGFSALFKLAARTQLNMFLGLSQDLVVGNTVMFRLQLANVLQVMR